MFAIGSSAVVHRPGHRMPGDERRRHSGLQHRVTQFSLKQSSPRDRPLFSSSSSSVAWPAACPKRLANSGVENTSSEPVVLLHQPIKVRAAELSPDGGHPIPQLVFHHAIQPPATGVPVDAVNPGTLLPERCHPNSFALIGDSVRARWNFSRARCAAPGSSPGIHIMIAGSAE